MDGLEKEFLSVASRIAEGRPITKAILIYEAIDNDGLQMLGSYGMDGMTPWDIIGMLDFKLNHMRGMADNPDEDGEE